MGLTSHLCGERPACRNFGAGRSDQGSKFTSPSIPLLPGAGSGSFQKFVYTHKSLFLTGFLLVVSILFIHSTFEEIISDKTKQIDNFQKEIDETRSRISSHSLESANIQRQIDSVEISLKTIDDFLKDYQNQSYLSPDQVAIETNMVLFLEEEVANIQQSFRNKIINLYKHGKNYELELLMSSKNPNEFLRRNEYLQKFAQNRRKDLRDLKSKKFILEEKKKMLTLSTSSQRFYVESRRRDKDGLNEKLSYLKTQKSKYDFESQENDYKITRREQQINGIKTFVDNFSANQQNFKGSKNNRLGYSSDNFESIKGSMNLPADIGLITSEFGEYFNNATGTKIYNLGVNFSIAKGSRVYAVANGTVSLIGEVPYYGKVIIINHDNGYRTVYSVLSEVSVNIGDKIHLNQVIGKSGETIDGQVLHFELWLNTTPLNPRQWLRF